MKLRQYLVVLIFFFASIAVTFHSFYGDFGDENEMAGTLNTPQKNDEEESYFKMVDYYILKSSIPFIKLESTELTFSKQNTVVIAFNPQGIIHRYNNKNTEIDPLLFKAKNAKVLMSNKELTLNDNVQIDLNTSSISADSMSIVNNGDEVRAHSRVKTKSIDPKTSDEVMISSGQVVFLPNQELFDYKTNVVGSIMRKRKYEDSVAFTTDNLMLSALLSTVEMTGNVTFKKGNLEASSNRGSIFLENYNKKLKYYSLSDDVKLRESLILGEKPVMRKAFAEKLEGMISDKKIVLTGLPKVFQGNDVIKGNRITIRENIETVEVDDAITNITLEREGKESRN